MTKLVEDRSLLSTEQVHVNADCKNRKAVGRFTYGGFVAPEVSSKAMHGVWLFDQIDVQVSRAREGWADQEMDAEMRSLPRVSTSCCADFVLC